MSDAYANLKRLREKAIAALDAGNDATERATEIGERLRQAALPTLTAAILERVNAADLAIAAAVKAHDEACSGFGGDDDESDERPPLGERMTAVEATRRAQSDAMRNMARALMECAFDLDDRGLRFAGETAAEAYEAGAVAWEAAATAAREHFGYLAGLSPDELRTIKAIGIIQKAIDDVSLALTVGPDGRRRFKEGPSIEVFRRLLPKGEKGGSNL